ncbi:MAG: response regulator [Deltaproteobacteria bacterium]|nr:response regulator [Deltaproteobacteria bacterium]
MKKILLVEDDLVMRQNTTEILELSQYEVLAVEDGKKALRMVKLFHPDLIVCDIMMPELDGYGVLHILSKDRETASIPFIFLTAKAEKSELRKGMELGADDYLTKPFEETELLAAIECRLKKNEMLKNEYAQNIEGLHQFLDEAKGMVGLDLLAYNTPVLHYKRKEVIFHEGDSPTHLFLLNFGKIKTYKIHDDGKEYVTSLYKEGDYFGYTSMLENVAYSDSAIALEDCELCKIPKEVFLSLLYQNRDIASKFIKMLSNRIIEREKQLLSLAYDTVRKRVAETLSLLARRFAEQGKKKARVMVTRDDLAGMVGTAAETVIRCLSELKMDKLIEVNGREIVVLDFEGLQQIQ